MKRTLVLVALGAAAVAVTAQAVAAPVAAKQRVAITSKAPTNFVLTPLTPGTFKRDTGVMKWGPVHDSYITRDGLRVEVNTGTATFVSKVGTFSIRARIEWMDAGHNISVGNSTWTFTGGSGVYAGLSGRGRSATSWRDGGTPFWRTEALFSAP